MIRSLVAIFLLTLLVATATALPDDEKVVDQLAAVDHALSALWQTTPVPEPLSAEELAESYGFPLEVMEGLVATYGAMPATALMDLTTMPLQSSNVDLLRGLPDVSFCEFPSLCILPPSDDTYTSIPTGIVIELGGDDTYELGDDELGFGGSIFLDLSGNDTYEAGSNSIGSGGVFADFAGNDRYRASAQSFAYQGVFFDFDGNDEYVCASECFGVEGHFVDAHGHDRYFAGDRSFGRGLPMESPDLLIGAFGLPIEQGWFVDVHGNDQYNGGSHSFGTEAGFFVDVQGHDVYRAHERSFAYLEGMFLDIFGHDQYNATSFSFAYNAGLFIDVTGNDHYGAHFGSFGRFVAAHFIDADGDDEYHSTGGSFGTEDGLFYDILGYDDYYTGGAATYGDGGIFVDAQGNDKYEGDDDPSEFARGESVAGPNTGIFIDGNDGKVSPVHGKAIINDGTSTQTYDLQVNRNPALDPVYDLTNDMIAFTRPEAFNTISKALANYYEVVHAEEWEVVRQGEEVTLQLEVRKAPLGELSVYSYDGVADFEVQGLADPTGRTGINLVTTTNGILVPLNGDPTIYDAVGMFVTEGDHTLHYNWNDPSGRVMLDTDNRGIRDPHPRPARESKVFHADGTPPGLSMSLKTGGKPVIGWLGDAGVDVATTAFDFGAGLTELWIEDSAIDMDTDTPVQMATPTGAGFGDRSSWSQSETFSSLTEGTHHLYAAARDAVGFSTMQSEKIKVDKTAPTLTMAAIPTGWLQQTPDLEVTISDALSGPSEIDWVLSSTTGGQSAFATGGNGSYDPGLALGDGEYIMAVYGYDSATPANEAVKHGSFKIDATPPMVLIAPHPTSSPPGATVAAAGMDATSGLKSLQVKVNNGPYLDQDQITLTAVGLQTITFRAEDNAGNVAEESTVIDIVNPPPVPSFTMSTTTILSLTNVTFTDTTTDDNPFTVLWDFGNGNTHTDKELNQTFLPGTHVIRLTATDIHGASAFVEQTLTVTNRPPTLSVQDESVLSLVPWAPTAVAEDEDGTIQSLTWTVDGRTHSTPVPLLPGTYPVEVVATDDMGDTASANLLLTVENQAPTGSLLVTVMGQFVDLQAFGIDMDGSIADWEFLLDGQSVSTGASSYGMQVPPGDHSATLILTDDLGATTTYTEDFTIEQPAIAFAVQFPASAYTYDFIGSHTIVESIPDSVTIVDAYWGDDFAPLNNEFVFQFTDDGTYTGSLTMVDDLGRSVTDTWTIDILNRAPNATATHTALQVLTGEDVTFTSTANDWDGTVTSEWELDGTLHADPATFSFDDDGTYTVTLHAVDDDLGQNSTSFTVEVANRPPVASFVHTLTDRVLSLTDTSTDADGTFTSAFLVNGAAYSGELLPPGNHVIQLTVADDDGATDTATASFDIQNQPPVAAFTHQLNNRVLTVTDQSTDPDGTVTSTFTVNGAAYDGAALPPGTHTVLLTATDNLGATDTATASFTIANQDPTATVTHSVQDNVLTFTVSASDPENRLGDVFAMEGAADVASGDTFAPGTHTVHIKVHDQDGGSWEDQFTFAIENALPTGTISGPSAANAGEEVTFTVTASDRDSAVSTSWENNEFTSSFEVGTHAVTVTLFDLHGGETTLTHQITVTEVIRTTETDEESKETPASFVIPLLALGLLVRRRL